MLPEEVPDLLREWWKERPTDQDAGVAPRSRWLFPGCREHRGLTTRQFNRLGAAAAELQALHRSITIDN